jgi:amino acid adenylation domain-containing protein/non-ribosomal peptide synthase protein (TIGR01720 family)
VAWCNFIHTIVNSGCLCIPSDEERKGDIITALHKYKPNYIALTPSVAWFPASELPDSVHTFHMGGESLKASLVKELSSRAVIIHAYGPAECSTVSTAIETNPDDDADPPIGRSLGCCTWVIKLNGSDLAPIGETGELWIEGPIVGQGYFGEPEKTAAAFVENPPWLLRGCAPLSHRKGNVGRRGRLYRTGDLVRYRPDGNLEFVGRKDSQVKIRGQRVELGEIEYHLDSALTAQNKADNVHVIAEVIKLKNSDTPTLVSFFFMAPGSSVTPANAKIILAEAIHDIEDRLAKLVPPYMVPSAFLIIEQAPLTPTGKLDRKSLREQGQQLYWEGLKSQDAPKDDREVGTATENIIRKIWSKVLNVPLHTVGLDINFTRLGGDSITAMQVVSRCRQENVFITVANILKLHTVRNIAQASNRSAQNTIVSSELEVYDDDRAFPLSPIQQMFFNDNPGGVDHYSLSFITKLARNTTHSELLAGLVAVTTRHSMLRARFRKSSAPDSIWEQYTISASVSSFGFEQHDFVNEPKMQSVIDQRQANLSLTHGPVFAVDVFNGAGEQTLLMSAHHIVMDLVSWRVIWHDLSRILSGQTSLPPVELTFPQWCDLQRREAEQLQPDQVLPFKVSDPNYEYWGTCPNELFCKDSAWHSSFVEEQATSLLLNASNDYLRTEILDILIGTLIYCFAQIFPDRSTPAVFVETHGREPISYAESLDLSETVGWFTSMFPVEISDGSASSVVDMIKFAKDTRLRVPGKGRPYFACRHHSSAGQKFFETHKHPEVIFNYRGSFQQLEDAESLLRLEDRPERNLPVPAEGPDYRRPSLIDMNLVVENGKLHVATRSHKNMRNHEGVIRWLEMYTETLRSVSHELAASTTRQHTLMDFPLLQISYDGLESLVKQQLADRGIKSINVKDIYPCTPMQEGILFSSMADKASYHSVCIWDAKPIEPAERVSIAQLAKAWESVAIKHPVTSTIFVNHPETGRYVQVVLKDVNRALLCTSASHETALEHLTNMPSVEAHVSQSLCFFTICSSENGDVACRLDMSHALMDVFSVAVLAQDLEIAYSGQILSLRTPFRDVVEDVERRSSAERQLYWTNYLQGVQSCELAGDLTFSGRSSKVARDTNYGWIGLPASATANLSRICREINITRSAFLEIAWSLVLYRLTGMKEVCFGYISSGRDAEINGIQNVVGPLINMLVARINLDQPLHQVLPAVTTFNIDHLDHQHVSLAELQHQASVDRLFNTCVTVGEAPAPTADEYGSLKLVKVLEQDPHEYDLVLAATLDKDNPQVNLQYREDVFSAANARMMQRVLLSAIEFLSAAVQDLESENSILCENFFNHSAGVDEARAVDQWRTKMKDLDAGCNFPILPYSSDKVYVDATSSQLIDSIVLREDHSIATQVLASWAILQASYGASTDVLVGWQKMTDAMPKPLRTKMDLGLTVSQFLELVQTGIAETETLPEIGANRLRRLGGDTALACDFQTVWSIKQTGATRSDRDDKASVVANAPRALLLSLAVIASGVEISAAFDSNVVSHEQVARLLCQLEAVLRQVSQPKCSATALAGINTVSENDMKSISSWNGDVPDSIHALVHDIFTSTAKSMPDAPAISAWNGELTYRELDQLSTRLAHKLVSLGVGPDVIVPLHFEKSMWEPVAVLAVMKAGGASVAIDSLQPVQRAIAIVAQVDAPVILVSSTLHERAVQFQGPKPFVLDQTSIDNLPDPEDGIGLPSEVQPHHLVYVCFTSGSTGQPKGAMITHSNFTSAIKYQQKAMGFRAGRRVFDFASYSFDVAWSNVLHTLTSGSCLCIPSEHQRHNDLSGAIKQSKATFLDVTPSVLRTLNPREFPDLETAMLGGEPFTEADVADWFAKKEMINTYGPAECSIRATITSAIRGIGVGYGMNTWIVTVDGSDRLSPMGAIGELWLEGPLVGRGYLGNEAITASAFVTRRNWVTKDESRFYRTGDLVRYEPDGSLMCVGRKDFQVKIRGQRTELGEVEHNIQTALIAVGLEPQLMVDVFKPRGSDAVILVAFFKCSNKEDARRRFTTLEELLPNMMPEYMIPTVFVGLDTFPMTSNGKTDRKSLRATCGDKTLEQLLSNDIRHGSNYSPPSTTSEKFLCDLWADTLNMNADVISVDSNFFRIGGDSLGAMRLVSAARQNGVVFSVADVFKNPQLSALANVLLYQDGVVEDSSNTDVEPFSLIDDQVFLAETKAHAARLCGIEPEDVEDVLPCTPLQEGLIAESVQGRGDNKLTEIKTLMSGVECDRLLRAWSHVVQKHPILRTRFVDLPNQGLVQVVVRHEQCGFQERSSEQRFKLGMPLFFCTVSSTTTIWSIHHALYDGWSWPLIMSSLCKAYLDQSIPDSIPFRNFVKYVKNIDSSQAERFWKDQFQESEAQSFPTLPSKDYVPMCDSRLERDIGGLIWDGDSTAATKIRLAWAILLSAATNSWDVLFGATVSGRQAPVPGVEHISGPTFATVPLRIVLDSAATVKTLLQQVQDQAVHMIPFEQVGLQNIQRMSEDCKFGCQFQSQVVVQPVGQDEEDDVLFAENNGTRSFDTYPISIGLEFVLRSDGVTLHARYDSAVVSQSWFTRIAERFEVILHQLCDPDMQSKPLSSLDRSSKTDLEQIWTWNKTPLEAYPKTIHEMFVEVAEEQPDAPAICAWDGDFTYQQLNDLSSQLARKLVNVGLARGTQRIVPILFEKSRWTSVAQLGVMKANGTAVVLDSILPAQRLLTIFQLTQPQVVLVSQEQESQARELLSPDVHVIVVDESHMSCFDGHDVSPLASVDPATWAYIVFTSGTTGTPKGAIVSHSNFTSALHYGLDALGFSKQTRSYDLASYAFDVSWVNLLYTLCAGGCLCIPTQEELKTDPLKPIERMQINTAQLTPTVAKLLRSANLSTINFGGEVLPRDEIDYWKDRAKLMHSYGPSECTPCAVSRILDPTTKCLTIGKGVGTRTWVVDPEHGNSLMAIGDIGELWLEGPLIGQGYLNDDARTNAAFIENPEWLLCGVPGITGRQGRLYRTGDLVRYCEDGDLEFIGRKDAQVKIRGQRVELEEMEHHILNAIGPAAAQIVVDVVVPADSEDRLLVAFIKLSDPKVKFSDTDEAKVYAHELAAAAKDILLGTIPAYMIPNAYLIVEDIPQTTSGKTDRGKIRKMASALRRSDMLYTNQRQRRAPETDTETRLHQIVAQTLSLDAEIFGMEDNFIQLGGDSISAMKLVARAQADGLVFSVADVLTKKHIGDLTSSQIVDANAHVELPLLSPPNTPKLYNLLSSEVLSKVEPGHGNLIDIQPATHMQTEYLRDNLFTPRRSWFSSWVEFSQIEDEVRLVQSVEKLYEDYDIYRTAFIESEGRFYQAIFDSWQKQVEVVHDTESAEAGCEKILASEAAFPAVLGAPLTCFILVRGPDDRARLVFSMSHAIYDAISLHETLQALADNYNDRTQPRQNWRPYMAHIESRKENSYAYWSQLLQGSKMIKVPVSSLEDGLPIVLTQDVPMPNGPSGITQASLFTLACAESLRQVTGESDIVFGRLVSGRIGVDAPFQNTIGPCINRVPVRIDLRSELDRTTHLKAIQGQYAEGLAHETVGLSDIVRNCTGWPKKTEKYTCFVQYQNVSEYIALDIPGVVEGLRSRDALDIPMAADYLEFFAIPDEGDSGKLRIRVIAGQGIDTGLPQDLLRGIVDVLSSF